MQKKLFLGLLFIFTVLVSVFTQDVNSSGAFTYSYPIEIPAGTNGMEPSLSLNYNSQAGNGMLGMGWSLSGFQTISRDTTYDLKWDDTDHFLLNGQRLIPDGSVYRTENESFLKIEYINKTSNTASYWVVTHKNGDRLYFGNTADSRIEGIDKGEARIWALNKVIDVHGNYYTIEYKEDIVGGDYYPQKMVYTKNDGNSLLKIKEVIFSYETNRTDHFTKYNPSKIDLNERLRWICVLIDGQLLRKYELKYQVQSDSVVPSQLLSIQQYGAGSQRPPLDATGWVCSDVDSLRLPEVKIGWSEGNSNFTDKTYQDRKEQGWNTYQFRTADIDGDGESDLVWNSVSTHLINRTYVSISNGDGTFKDKTYHDRKEQGWNSYQFRTADINGDGKSDLVWNSVSTHLVNRTYVSISNGDGTFEDRKFKDKTYHDRKEQGWNSYQFRVADINGDGKSDLVWNSTSTDTINRTYVSISKDDGTFDDKTYQDRKEQGWNTYLFRIADINGDGKSDLVWNSTRLNTHTINRTYFSLSNGDGTFDDRTSEDKIFHDRKEQEWKTYQFSVADINGDGRSDLVWNSIGTHTMNRTYVSISKDDGTFEDKSYHDRKEQGWNTYQFRTADINGDGKSDLVWNSISTHLVNRTYVSISNGDGTFEDRIFEDKTYHDRKEQGWNTYHFRTADINGDGKSDLVWNSVSTHTVNRTYVSLTDLDIHYSISSITLPSGASITPTYTPAPQTPDAINPSDSTYPNISNKSPRTLVTSLDITDGMGNNYTTTYKYNNGKLHRAPTRDGRKSLGFEWIQKTNPDGTFIKTYYYQEEALSYAGLIKRVEHYGSDEKLYRATENKYLRSGPISGSAGYLPINLITKTDSYSYNYNGATYTDWESMKLLGGVIKTHKNFTYDTFGNVIKILDKGDLSDRTDDSLTVSEYIHNASNYIFAPKFVKTYSFGLDEELFKDTDLNLEKNLSSHVEFYYDNKHLETDRNIGNLGLLTKKVIASGELDQSKYPDVSNTFSYDVYGNLKTFTDGNGNESTINYESNYHSLVESIVNTYGQTTEFISYDAYLRAQFVQDMNNIHTWFTYDSFGRKTEIAKGDALAKGLVLSKFTYPTSPASIGNPRVSKNEVYLPESAGAYLESYSYSDGLGRVLQHKTEGLDETNVTSWITTDFHYAIKSGQKSESYSSNVSTFNKLDWDLARRESRMELDEVGRLKQIDHPDGISEHYLYGLKDKTTLILNHGDLTKNQIYYDEIDGTNQYSYSYPLGTYTLANMANFGKSAWTYKVSSRSARDGAIINEISKEDELDINNTGNTITTLVDRLGRKKTYDDPDMGLWSYAYDGNNNLLSQSDAKNNLIEFVYDNLNRTRIKKGADTVYYNYDGLNNDRTASDGKDHGTTALGRLTNTTFGTVAPYAYTEDYTYNDVTNDYSITKSIDGKSRSHSVTLDDLGRLKSEIYPGGGETLTYAYNQAGYLNTQTSSLNLNYISDFKYTIEGKIKAFNQGNGISTSYVYDEKRRLINMNISKSLQDIGDMHFKYDNYGNITEKTFIDGFSGNFIETYVYDDYLRLKESTTNVNGSDTTRIYDYDSYNNMILKDGKKYKYDGADITDGGVHAVDSIVDSADNVLKTYEYDANGNVIKIEGQSELLIRAKGTGINAKPPRMELWINGEKRESSWTVNNTEYQLYTWYGYIAPLSSVDLVFVNDNSEGGVDTNLQVDFIVINGIKLEPELAANNVTIDRGGYYLGCFDGNNTITATEVINLTGAMRFPMPLVAKSINRDLVYDKENRLQSIWDNSNLIASYRYDDSGQRIWKKEKGVETYYFFESYEEKYESNVLTESIKYYYANGKKQAMRSSVDGLSYYHSDHLGSAVRMTDEVGNIVESVVYTPFGKVAWYAGEKRTNYTYTGQESDDTGFLYYNARYYDPDLGRFLQADTYLDGMNRYTYCGNNPVIYNDPTGFKCTNNAGGHTCGLWCGGSGEEEPETGEEPNDPDDTNVSGSTTHKRGGRRGDRDDDGESEGGGNGPSVVLPPNGGGNGEGPDDSYVKDFFIGFGKQGLESVIYIADIAFQSASPFYFIYRKYRDATDLFNAYNNSGAENPINFIIGNVQQTIDGFGEYAKKEPAELAGRLAFMVAEAIIIKKLSSAPKAGNVGGACFVEGTLISTENGLVPIEEIKVGDLVYAFNEETGEKSLKKVVNTFIHDKDELIIIKVDGEVIETTEEHPFWVPEKGWVLAGGLTIDDKLQLFDGSIIEIKDVQIKKLSTLVEVYNFEVEEWHTYFVSSSKITVHNKAAQRTMHFGKHKVKSLTYHREIKPAVLSQVDDYMRFVGDNPNIKVLGNGRVMLEGVGDFAGKSLRTTLRFIDFLD